MPRGTKSRANARPDTQIGGRSVHTRGGITPKRPGRAKAAQTADALASALGATSDIAEVYGKHQRVEDAKQQRLQAFKDFHKDATNDVSRDEAEKRAAFSNDDYRKTYMRLSYSQQAKGLSSDIQQHAQDMMNDPDVGVDEVEQYIDATTSGAIQGIDDPEAVDVFANRLTSDAEQLKKKARGIAVERQQTAGEAKLNGFIDDAVSEGIDGPDFVNHALKMAGNLNVSQDSARAAIAQAVVNKADQATDPSMLDVLDAKGDDGVALSDYPEIHDTVERARQKIEADVDQQTSAAELKQRYALRRKMDSGALTMSDIQRVNHDHPDWYTPDQLTSMLSRSQSKAQKVTAQRREAAAATAGRVSPVAMRMKTHSDQQAVFGHMREGIFGQHEDTPEGRQQAFMDYATRVAELSGGVAGVKDDWLAAQLNAGAEAPSPDGSMPDAFRAGYQRYKMLKHDPQTRGLLDNLL
ncbi:hypothetical protein HKX42_03810 [Salinisphaera sp. USBA-960]|nr:hypothetical protein [Salifodinibacter halophilus]NNC26003.1 hypothetical protein [Salifodinibacter halophilus]